MAPFQMSLLSFYRLVPRLRRAFPYLEFHHIVMAILAITICLSSLLLAGCSSSRSALSTIHLVELSYRRSAITSNPTIPSTLNSTFSGLVGNASMTVRVGYFGLCTRLGNEGWICHKDASSFATSINAAQDPLNLISNCMTFRSSIIFSGLVFISTALGFICIPLLATFPGWNEEVDDIGSDREVKPFPSEPISRLICGILFVASFLALLSALWQHTAAVAFATTVQNMAYGSVKSKVGAAAIGLGWAALALHILAFLPILIMIEYIRKLDLLTDDE